MTKPIGDRIQIDVLIDILSDLTYEEVTEKKLLEDYFVCARIVEEDIIPLKNIHVDDYIFTIRPIEENVAYSSGIKVNNSILLLDTVNMYLPYGTNEEKDLLAEGKIVKRGNRMCLQVTYEVL